MKGDKINEEKGMGIITDCGSILLAVSHRNGKRRGFVNAAGAVKTREDGLELINTP